MNSLRRGDPGLSALRSQAESETMKAIAIGKRLRQVHHDATHRDEDLGSEF